MMWLLRRCATGGWTRMRETIFPISSVGPDGDALFLSRHSGRSSPGGIRFDPTAPTVGGLS